MTNPPSALVLLAEGAEEIEALTPVDVFRRAGITVTLAGVNGPEAVLLSRQVKVTPDCSLKEVLDKQLKFNLVVCPGGAKGSQILRESPLVKQVLQDQNSRNGLIAAVCAGPTALKSHGICVGQNRKVTSYPSTRATMEEGGAYVYSEERVVVDGNLVTSRGPGTSAEWSIRLAELLVGKAKADEVAQAMLLKF